MEDLKQAVKDPAMIFLLSIAKTEIPPLQRGWDMSSLGIMLT